MIKLRKVAIKLIITILILLIAMTIIISAKTYAQKTEIDSNALFLIYVKEYIMDRYNDDITESDILEGALSKIIEANPELMEEALKGMFEPLDQHSVYFTQEEYESFATSVEGQFGGIGISVTKKDDAITILTPIRGTPGERVGLLPGDKIIYVNDIDVSKYEVDIAVPLMRGEPGTIVTLGIKRKDNNEILYFNISREIIKINPIYYEILEDDIGYIEITDFNDNTVDYLQEALKELDLKGIKKLIIDLRNNPGGSLAQVIHVADNFIPNEEKIVSIDYRGIDKVEEYHSKLKTPKYELITLINEGSASASEILAGAIQDTGAGIIIGEKSFGKGTVQELVPLKIGGAVKMTIAKYLTPSGKIIDGDGIHPDIRVKNEIEDLDINSLQKFEYSTKPAFGDQATEVLAAEQRLELLGYDIEGPDEILDENTHKAIIDFQERNNLYAYGVLDFITQLTLDQAVDGLKIEIDRQLQQAIEIYKTED